MSDKEQIKIISKLDDTKIKNLLVEIEELEKNKKYYYALNKLDNLIQKDGTIEKLNDKFLNLILDHYEDIMDQIKNSSGIKLDESEEKMNEEALGDIKIYNFYYFRDCFDRYEVTLSQQKLENISNKKKIHNKKIIEKYPSIRDEYLDLIAQIENKEVSISADTIYDTIKKLNESIISEDDTKLFYIYKYLDVSLIMNNKIFDLILQDRFYLNRYSFGFLDELGIPIGFSENITLKYRYIFSLIKDKIIEIDIYNKNNKNHINKKLKKKKGKKKRRKAKIEEVNEEKKEEDIKNKKEGDKKDMEKDKKDKIKEDKEVKKEEDKEEKKEEDIKDKIEEDNEEKKEEDIKDKKEGDKKGIEEDTKDKIEEDIKEKKEEDIKDMEEDTKEKKEEDKKKKDIEFVFKTFKDIFSKFEKNKLNLFEYFKYFALLFNNVMFEGENSITEIYEDSTCVASSYFRILCEQFSLYDKNVDDWLKKFYESTKKKKIEFFKKNLVKFQKKKK